VTPSPDATIETPIDSVTDSPAGGTGLAGPGLLRMVGASGAVCVDGSCSFDPVVQPSQEGDRADS
jgi:hypothetical protein